MRRVKCFLIPLLIFTLFFWKSTAAQATGFELVPSDEEKIERVFAFHDFQFLEKEPTKCPITRFAVNQEGYIALGYDTQSSQRVVVYKDSQYQYGYSFYGEGVFYLEVTADSAIVTFVRGDVSVELGSNGKVSVLGDVVDSKKNHDYQYEELEPVKKVVGDKTYRIQTDPEILYFMFTPNYTHLTVTEADGRRTVLYDATEAQWAGMGKTVIAFVAFACVSAGFALYQRHMKKKRNM